MLTELEIRNFAIIDELKIEFSPGLNILTGETGAGKSIIVGALGLLLGDKASPEMIRTGEDTALVAASFELTDPGPLNDLLKGWGLEGARELVVRRTLSRSGRGRAYINGSVVTLTMLADLCETLLSICGQHEHQVLLKEENHLDILDAFGRLLPLREEYTKIYDILAELHGRREELLGHRRRRSDRQEFLRHQIGLIDEVKPRPGEDKVLVDERSVVVNARQLSDLSFRAYNLLYGDEGSVMGGLRTAVAAIRDICRMDPRLAVSVEELDDIYYRLEEAAFTLRNYASRLNFDPERLEAIDERLEKLNRLKRLFGGDLVSVLAKRAEMEGELESLGGLEEEIAALEGRIAETTKRLEREGLRLSHARREAARRLEEAVEGEGSDLRMEGMKFRVVFREPSGDGMTAGWGRRGGEAVVFHLSTNPGEDVKPLSRVASGGELSRVVLAMRKVLAETGAMSTIVLDEVDSGIGGATAEKVGLKVRQVADRHQVICITHLPQIACFGDRHYRVYKSVEGDRMITRIDIVDGRERIEEIARMLGGSEVTDSARIHAQSLLAAARGGGEC